MGSTFRVGESLIPEFEIDRLQKSMEVGHSNEPDGMKFVCDLSTLLVATIQEAKDRISQVEYIFCSKLYPTFQKNSKSLQNIYMEARKAAEEECKELHSKMTDQIDKLYLEKEKALEGKVNMVRKISELEEKLSSKDAELEKEKELQYTLQKAIESKCNDVDSKKKLLAQYEERLLSLFTNTRELEEEKSQLKEELGAKNEDLSKEKELQKEILGYVRTQAKKIMTLEELLQCNRYERESLQLKLENEESTIKDLTLKFGMKTIELEQSRTLQEQLIQKIDVHISEVSNKELLLTVYEKEKASLLSKLKDLEKKNEELQVNNGDGAFPVKSECYKQLEQKIELKQSELLTEKQKQKDLVIAYKHLKSKYNFLCTKSGLIAESTLLKPKHEVENDPRIHTETAKSKDSEEQRNPGPYQTAEAKKEIESGSDTNDEMGSRLNQESIIGAASKWKTSRNSSSSSPGGKCPSPDWRGTCSRQARSGPDPHDDFLDTPLENIRGNLAKAIREEIVNNIPAPVSKDVESDKVDGKTGIGIDAGQKEEQQGLKRSPAAFKYVEPVRKKAQREALKGIECKQCKKFYDAVIPDSGGEGNSGFRCEHLDGASRHRYKYAPPLTPEGFWNIGFDSEI